MVKWIEKMTISSPKDYNLIASVHAWIFPDIQPVPERTSASSIWRFFSIEDLEVGIRISQDAPGNKLSVEWTSPSISNKEIRSKLEKTLNLKMDMNPALEKVRKNENISFIFDSIKGIRPYLADSLFEALIKTVLQQQISYRAANVITQRMILRTATHEEIKSNVFSFPTPDEVLSLEIAGLRDLGVGYKSDYIHDLSGRVAKKDLNPEALQHLEFDEMKQVLKPLKGIGEWTIDVLAIAGIGNFTIYPFGDLGIQNLLGRIYSNGRRFSTNEVKTYSDSFNHEGPLILYLLMCADVLGFMEEYSRSGKP